VIFSIHVRCFKIGTAIIVDESLLNRETLTSYEALAVNHEAVSPDEVTINIDYKYEDSQSRCLTFMEARSQNRRTLSEQQVGRHSEA